MQEKQKKRTFSNTLTAQLHVSNSSIYEDWEKFSKAHVFPTGKSVQRGTPNVTVTAEEFKGTAVSIVNIGPGDRRHRHSCGSYQ